MASREELEIMFNISGFNDVDTELLWSAVEIIYNGSETFRSWVGEFSSIIYFEFDPGHFDVSISQKTAYLDLEFVKDLVWVTEEGAGYKPPLEAMLVHELTHILKGLDDLSALDDTNYKGLTLAAEMVIYSELGFENRLSYMGTDLYGEYVVDGENYTNGNDIDRSIYMGTYDVNGNPIQSWDSSPAGDSRDLLISDDSGQTLLSGEGKDYLYGNGGDDYLDGGEGSDYMAGGSGNDIYRVDNENDEVIEGVSEGDSDALFTTVDYVLEATAEVESITLGDDARVVRGSDTDNKIYGNEYENILYGEGGGDKLYGEEGNDTLEGGDGEDSLYGGLGSDFLVGGESNDRMEGGDGYDIYHADKNDIILDTDGSGYVELDGSVLNGGSRTDEDPENTYKDGNDTYVLNGSTLTVNGGLTIESFTNGDLGIVLSEEDEDEEDDDGPSTDDASNTTSPIILDLDGDGVETTRLLNYFDHDGDGFQEKTGWIGADDAFLAMDRNGDGQINSGLELFGSNTELNSGEVAENGYEALDDLDSNEDGIISVEDDAWSELRVWQDVNGNAAVDDGELKTLDEQGIESINLAFSESASVDIYGNEHKLISSMTMTDGSELETADVWFQIDRTQRLQADVELSEDIIALPDARGFGSIADLRVAMASNETLKTMVEQYVAEADPVARQGMIESMIFEWAGVSDVDPYSRDPSRIYGHVMDARQLETLEALVGESYVGIWCWGEEDPNPHGQAAPKLIAEFNKFAGFFESQLLAQTQYAEQFGWIKTEFNTNGKVILGDFDQFESMILSLEAQGNLDLIADLAEVANDLGTYSSRFRDSLADSVQNLIAVKPLLSDVLDGSLYEGTELSDSISASHGDDVLYGKEGDDRLYGNAGNDVYTMQEGDGTDHIWDSAGNDTLHLGAGYSSSNVRLSRDSVTLWIDRLDENGNQTGDRIYIDNFYNFDGTLDAPVETIEFGDGETWDLARIQQELLANINDDDNEVYGSQGVDTIDALDGNDVIWAYAGDDQISGSAGDDQINAGYGDDILIGGSGNDYLLGDEGSDEYVFSSGHGQDVVNNFDQSAGSIDRIRFDSTIAVSDINLVRDGLDLLIQGQGTDEVRVSSFFADSATSAYALDEIVFEDGTVWDNEHILAAVQLVTEGDDFVQGYDSVADVIDGLGGDDRLYGAGGDDSLNGDAGADTLYGQSGNDQLQGGDGNDYLYGGEDNDHLYGNAGNDNLQGDDGDDWLVGGDGNDSLAGGRGHDHLYGGEGNDWLRGGRGDDLYYFAQGGGVDHIVDQQGELTIYVSNLDPEQAVFRREGTSLVITFTDNPEPDAIYVDNWFNPSTLFAYSGISIGIEGGVLNYLSSAIIETATMTATEYADVLEGNTAANYIEGWDGNDQIHGYGGDDILRGDEGQDQLFGDAGNDDLGGGDGADTLSAGEGNDTLHGGLGNDALLGGAGDDLYHYNNGEGEDTITDSSGNDSLLMLDHPVDNLLFRRQGNDLIIIDKLAETDRQQNGSSEGIPVLVRVTGQFSLSTDVPSTAVESFTFSGGVQLTATEMLAEVIEGSVLDDSIEAHAGADTINAGDGDDEVYARGGNDTVAGGLGNDTLNGEDGNDILIGDDGDDQLHGGSGDDSLYGGEGNDQLHDYSGENTLDGGAGDDQLVGGYDDDHLIGGTGNDELVGNGGYDLLEGGDGTDSLSGDGELYGGDGNDYLEGTGLLDGGSGDDELMSQGTSELIGGVGNDTLYGTFSDEVYRFNLGDGQDTVIETAQGQAYSNVAPSNDTLVFGAGIALSDLAFERHDNDLVIKHTNGTDQITITNWYEEPTEHYKINNFSFSDDTVLTDVQVEAMVVTYGSSEDDTLLGYRDKNDVIVSGDGQDQVWGREGNDQIYGEAGDDYLDGDEGDDHLYGGLGSDNLVGRTGEDALYGEEGDDTLQGMEDDDLLVGGVGEDTLFGGTGNDQLDGGSEDDYLDGGAGDDQLLGGAGSDQLKGGAGDDIYTVGTGDDMVVIGDGDGHDTIDVSDGGSNGIYFDTGLTIDRLTVTQDGDDLLILVDDGVAQTIRVVDHFLGGEAALDWLQPAGGSMIGTAQINQMAAGGGSEEYDTIVTGTASAEQLLGTSGTDLIQGLGGNDQLYGFGGNDRLEGGDGADYLAGGNGSGNGSGDDVLIGGEGDDTLSGEDGNDQLDGGNGNDHYYYYAGTGQDIITDSGDGQDVLFFNDVAPERLSYHQDGDDLIVLVDGDLDQQVRVVNHFLGGDNAIMVQPDGGYTQTPTDILNQLTALPEPGGEGDGGETGGDNGTGGSNPTVSLDFSGDDEVLGSSADEILVAGAGNDELQGLAGDDRLIGGTGDDTYVIGSNSGNDVVFDSAGTNTIHFTDGLSFNDVASGLMKAGDDLILNIGSNGDSVRIAQFFSVANTIETMTFDDASELTAAQVYGAFGLSAPTATAAEGDLVLGNGQDNTLSATSDNDTVLAGQGDDTLNGLGGDDRLIGGAGDDTYVIGASSGQDTIIDTAGVNTISFVDGIGFNDIASGLMGSGNDLILNIGSTGNQVTITDFFAVANTIDNLTFEDGSQITASQLYGAFGVSAPTATADTVDALTHVIGGTSDNDTINGSSADEFISGYEGDDELSGGAGNDVLDGGIGNDRILFGTGDGQDIIVQTDTETEGTYSDVLAFDSDVSYEDLWFSQNGDDLQINLAGTDDQVTISGWYSDASHQLDQFESGSLALANQQVDQLVSAMATYDVPSGAGNVIPQQVKDDLQPVLTQVWQSA